MIRELEKVSDALFHADGYLSKENEANAHLHLADRVLYSPLTVSVINARDSLDHVVNQLEQMSDW